MGTENQETLPNNNVRLIFSYSCLIFRFSDISLQPEPTGTIDALATETSQTKMTIFLTYLHDVKTILVHGSAAYELSNIRTLRMVAKRPDFRLPFRQKAPTMERALYTIYSDRDRLRTPEGFWNVLTFRGVTYGSPYAKNDLQWFNSYDEWADYYARSNDAVKGNKLRYFIDVCAYGFNNKHRKIENIKAYWEERHRWTSFIDGNPNVKEMYKFLTQIHKKGKKKVFPNIGSLTALLVCGDLIELKILDMPPIEDWAGLIYDVQKGATMGLQSLALLGEAFTQEEVVNAFTRLNAFLIQNLSEEDMELMGYNMVMLEHGLCKFTRILTKAAKVNSIHRKTRTPGKRRKLT